MSGRCDNIQGSVIVEQESNGMGVSKCRIADGMLNRWESENNERWTCGKGKR